ncbi:hypothetical protein JCM13210_09280 [Thermaerobacter litoralis]
MQFIVLGSRHRLGLLWGPAGRPLTPAQRRILSLLSQGRLEIDDLPLTAGEARGPRRPGPAYRATFRRPSGVSTARRRLQQALVRWGLGPALIQRVVLATAEAMINAVRYAGGGQLVVWLDGEGVRAVITDKGPGIAFDKLAQSLLSPRNQANLGRGHGYWLMVTMASRCRVASSARGTRVELVFDRGGSGEPPPQPREG